MRDNLEIDLVADTAPMAISLKGSNIGIRLRGGGGATTRSGSTPA
jgi:hypothetical protein